MAPSRMSCPPRPDVQRPKNQDMVGFIEIGVVRHAVAHEVAHALPDLERAFMPGFEFFLHELEFLGIGHIRRNGDARFGREAEDALLREVLRSAADVARPFVERPVRADNRSGQRPIR